MRPIDDFRLLQARLFAEAAAMGLDEAREWIDRRIYGEWVRSFGGIRPYRGLRELLDRLERRGLLRAVLSDLPVEEKLRYLGLSECFPVALCSEESGYLKPNPEPFALLCRRLGLEPAEILYVGDSYERDIVGARAAGLRTAHLAGRRAQRSAADVGFSRYRDLEGRLVALGLLPDAGPSPGARN